MMSRQRVMLRKVKVATTERNDMSVATGKYPENASSSGDVSNGSFASSEKPLDEGLHLQDKLERRTVPVSSNTASHVPLLFLS